MDKRKSVRIQEEGKVFYVAFWQRNCVVSEKTLDGVSLEKVLKATERFLKKGGNDGD